MKKLFVLVLAVAACMMISCKKDPKGGSQEDDNLAQTTVPGLYYATATLSEDPNGFNMFTDPGFEFNAGDVDWKAKSVWYLPDYISEAETPFNGTRSLYADCNTHDWRDVCIQSINVKKGVTYKMTVNYRGAWAGLNVYFGFRDADNGVVKDINTNSTADGSQFANKDNSAWNDYSLSVTNLDNTQFNCFLGGWCWDNLWLEVDDIKVEPEGSYQDSFLPINPSISDKQIKNTSRKVTALDNMIVWERPDGKLAGVLVGAVVDGKDFENVFFTGSYDKECGIKIGHIASAPLSGIIPTGGCTIDGTHYVFGYEFGGPGEDDWTSTGSSVYVSTDNGEHWGETAVFWGADSKFIKNSVCCKGDYIYIFGSPAGDKGVRTYVARVKPADFTELTKYEYWDGEIWAKGKDSYASSIMYGPTDLMSVVYNKSLYTYMMIYRSRTTGQLVYRDAGLPEGEWSGEKMLVADPSAASQLYMPFITGASDNKISFIACAKAAE